MSAGQEGGVPLLRCRRLPALTNNPIEPGDYFTYASSAVCLTRETLSILLVRTCEMQVPRPGGHQEVEARGGPPQSLGGYNPAQHFFGRVVGLLTQMAQGGVSPRDSAQCHSAHVPPNVAQARYRISVKEHGMHAQHGVLVFFSLLCATHVHAHIVAQ